jgi:hypothetical protein
MGERILMEIDGSHNPVDLYTDQAPVACRALLDRLPLEDEILHARLSGPLCLLRRINLADAPLENPVAFLNPGDIAYHPTHFDVSIAYGPTQFRELAGTVYVSLLGRVVGDLSSLIATGQSLPRTGTRAISLRGIGSPVTA